MSTKKDLKLQKIAEENNRKNFSKTLQTLIPIEQIKKKNQSKYNKVIKLFESGKIPQNEATSALTYLSMNNKSGTTEAIKLINKFKPEPKLKSFHIRANITVEIKVLDQRKQYVYSDVYSESKKIKAISKKQALQEFKAFIENEYSLSDSWYEQTVIDIEFVSVYMKDPTQPSVKISSVRMRKFDLFSRNVNYDYVQEDKSFLKQKDLCVLDNLVGYLGLKYEKVVKDLEEYYQGLSNKMKIH